MIDRVASWMRAAERVAVLTGAGISAESGVPVFRGDAGLWRQFRPEQLATPDAFNRQPELVWDWYLWRRACIAAVQPNAGHRAIARWQQQRAGNQPFGDFDLSRDTGAIFQQRADNIFVIKASYWFGR